VLDLLSLGCSPFKSHLLIKPKPTNKNARKIEMVKRFWRVNSISLTGFKRRYETITAMRTAKPTATSKATLSFLSKTKPLNPLKSNVFF